MLSRWMNSVWCYSSMCVNLNLVQDIQQVYRYVPHPIHIIQSKKSKNVYALQETHESGCQWKRSKFTGVWYTMWNVSGIKVIPDKAERKHAAWLQIRASLNSDMRENKIKCLLCEYAKMRAAVHEQRFWTELFLKCVGASLERDVSSGAQRSELVGIQSHRALLSVLSTSVSVCSRKETNKKTQHFTTLNIRFLTCCLHQLQNVLKNQILKRFI